MANDYTNLDNPYNTNLSREGDPLAFQLGGMTQSQEAGAQTAQPGGNTAASSSGATGAVQQASASNGGAFADLAIESAIFSKNWQPRTVGFYIDGKTGYAEFSNIYIKGGVISGSIDIPDRVSTYSFHTDSLGNSWWGATTFAAAPASISKEGNATFNSETFSGTFVIGDTQVTLEAGATTPDIAAAISQVSTAGGGIVYLGQGTTTLTASLTLPSKVTLSGVSGTILDLGGAYQINSAGTNAYTTGSVSIGNQGFTVFGNGTNFTSGMVGQYILLEDFWYLITAFNTTTSLTIDPTKPYVGTTLVNASYYIATTVQDVAVKNMTIRNSNINAINFQYIDNVTFTDLIIQDITNASSRCGIAVSQASRLLISNISAERCDIAMLFTFCRYGEMSNINAVLSRAGIWFVTSCRNWKNSTLNIQTTTVNQAIILNGVELMTFDSFSVNNTATGVSGVLFTGSASNNVIFTGGTVEAAGGSGINIQVNSQNIQVIGCQLINNLSYGISIASGCLDTVVTGNYARSNGLGDISDIGTRTVVSGNSAGFVQSPQISRVLSTMSVASSTSLTAIPNLSAIVKAGKAYTFECMLWLTSPGAGGLNVDMNGGTATMTSFIATYTAINDNNSTGSVYANRRTALSSVITFSGTNFQELYLLKGSFVVSGAGTFKPRFAQQTSDATASTVSAGSTLEVKDSDTFFSYQLSTGAVFSSVGPITESVTMFLPWLAVVPSENITITENISMKIVTLFITVSDNIAVSEFIDAEYAIPGLHHENIFISEVVALGVSDYMIQNITENINITEGVNVSTAYNLSVNDTVTVTESITTGVYSSVGSFGVHMWGGGGGGGSGGSGGSSILGNSVGGSGGSPGAYVQDLSYQLQVGTYEVKIGKGGKGGQVATYGDGGIGYKNGGRGGNPGTSNAGAGGGGGGSTKFYTLIAAAGSGGCGGGYNQNSGANSGAPAPSGTSGATGDTGTNGRGAGGGGAANTDGSNANLTLPGAGGTGATLMNGTPGAGGGCAATSGRGAQGGSSAGYTGNGTTGKNNDGTGSNAVGSNGAAAGSDGGGIGADGTLADSGGAGGRGSANNFGQGGPGGKGGGPGAGGGGGGQGSTSQSYGGDGADGSFVISYDTAALSGYTITGGTITTDGANTVHTFDSDGYFTIA